MFKNLFKRRKPIEEGFLDRRSKIHSITREHYGFDKDNKPNDHCIWSDFGYEQGWVESDVHLRKRCVQEPKVVHATIRESADWDIECRFSDGQKFAAITVDIEHEQLAHKICDFLNKQGKSEYDFNLALAAPELLKALKGMCKAYKALSDMTGQGDYISESSRYAHAQAVIKKARGE